MGLDMYLYRKLHHYNIGGFHDENGNSVDPKENKGNSKM